jgi:hypothetical protein
MAKNDLKMGDFVKWLAASMLGLVAVVEPSFKFAAVLFFAVLVDCLSAYDLSRRLAKLYPGRVCGKFQSRYALRMMRTFAQAYSAILLLYLVDRVLLDGVMSLSLCNLGSAVFVAVQLWSILENISSGNGARWAKVLQKLVADKAHRHLDIDITHLNSNENENTCNAAADAEGGAGNVRGGGADGTGGGMPGGQAPGRGL